MLCRSYQMLVFVSKLILIAASVSANGQGASTRVTGECNSVVTGNGNRVIINCSDVPAPVAAQLIKLMNRILAERLDVNEVNSKLDQMQLQLHGIQDALDPFANAPASVMALLKQGDLVLSRCSGLMGDWSQKLSGALEKTREIQKLQAPGITGVRTESYTAEAQEFATRYGRRLAAMNANYHRLMPDLPAVRDIGVPASSSEALSYLLSLDQFVPMYRERHIRQAIPINSGLIADSLELMRESLAYVRTWASSDLQQSIDKGRNMAVSSAATSERLATAKANVNKQETEQYHLVLEPQLDSYRAAVEPRIPDYAAGKTYHDVTSVAQLSSVCSDVSILRVAYRQQVGEDLKRASAKAIKH